MSANLYTASYFHIGRGEVEARRGECIAHTAALTKFASNINGFKNVLECTPATWTPEFMSLSNSQ